MTAGLLTEFDLHLIKEGRHYRTYDKLGAHLVEVDDVTGVRFAVWAPNARKVSVIGDFNRWDENTNPLSLKGNAGIWECFVPDLKQGSLYKFSIHSNYNEYHVEKADPYAFASENRPKTASKVWDNSVYQWQDTEWMKNRSNHNGLEVPMSIYEVHLGSWRRVPEENNRWLTYREMAPELVEYIKSMGFTHVEFLPVTEHPFDGSWGYQTTGYFSPTSRFGTPDDFKFLIDTLHQNGIGVMLDWVPAHFPNDGHGLGYFDGTHLYEHADPRQGVHHDWNTFIFNYGRPEVSNFLISNALFWLDKYHIDGLRVDAVASMLYLDYSRKKGEWIPNEYGGRENIPAINFLRHFNEQVYSEYPSIINIAEESTSWPMVSKPTYMGGLGFGLKWDMGWMHDTLEYMSKDSIHRTYHHNSITFRMQYAFHENFIMPLSHDEVVHGKGSLLTKMPGDYWQKFANLRLLYGYLYSQPGKKLLFMGGEFGQWKEWNHDISLDWHLLDGWAHRGLQRWVKDLNETYRNQPALYERDCQKEGFEWIDCTDAMQSILCFLRKGKNIEAPLTQLQETSVRKDASQLFFQPDSAAGKEVYGRQIQNNILVVCNFTPVPRYNYRVGVPQHDFWKELLNSDAQIYGGSGLGNAGGIQASYDSSHGRPCSLVLTLPPLSILLFKNVTS
ncbi:MAG: 1,4-alpha-glucan branching protein GlgB [Candidatus Aureabacteria bacterium]|nr:1,4-alpha-glucan branching protein GlgB [Candidatus Auribacterota bacterium]